MQFVTIRCQNSWSIALYYIMESIYISSAVVKELIIHNSDIYIMCSYDVIYLFDVHSFPDVWTLDVHLHTLYVEFERISPIYLSM